MQLGPRLVFVRILVMQSAATCQPQEASAPAPCWYLAATPDPLAGLSNPLQKMRKTLFLQNIVFNDSRCDLLCFLGGLVGSFAGFVCAGGSVVKTLVWARTD